jgi:hypothetical protein
MVIQASGERLMTETKQESSLQIPSFSCTWWNSPWDLAHVHLEAPVDVPAVSWPLCVKSVLTFKEQEFEEAFASNVLARSICSPFTKPSALFTWLLICFTYDCHNHLQDLFKCLLSHPCHLFSHHLW